MAGVALLLLLLALQVIISIRRDRRVAQAEDEDPHPSPGQPAYLEDLEFREQNLAPSRRAGRTAAAATRPRSSLAAPGGEGDQAVAEPEEEAADPSLVEQAAFRSRRSSLGSEKMSDSSALCTAWASG